MEINEQASSDQYLHLMQNLEDVRQGNAQIERRNDLLRVKIDAMREDPRARERKIRDEFRLIRSDEIVVFVRDEHGKMADWGRAGAEQRLIQNVTQPEENEIDISDELNMEEVFPDLDLSSGEDDQREDLPLAGESAPAAAPSAVEKDAAVGSAPVDTAEKPVIVAPDAAN